MGRGSTGRGYFYAPTVLTGVAPPARILREEVFGPVAPVTTFDSERRGASSRRTRPSSGWSPTSSPATSRRGLRVVEGIETGMVGLNRGLVSNAAAPFGGIKHSGFGREGGTEGIEEYLDDQVRRHRHVSAGFDLRRV